MSETLVAISDTLRLSIQVTVSIAFIIGVSWYLWRLPGEAVTESAAAPLLAFASAWLGLIAVGAGAAQWWVSDPDRWVVLVVLLYAAAISTGGFALWTYRHTPASQMTEPIQMQRFQARAGIVLGFLAVVLWYVFILTHLPPAL